MTPTPHQEDLRSRVLAADQRVKAITRALEDAERARDRRVAELDATEVGGYSHRDLAREMGVAHSTIARMARRGRGESDPAPDREPVPVLPAGRIRGHLAAGAFGTVAGALVAHNDGDILLECGRHPAVWGSSGMELTAPNMLLRSEEGQLLGVSGVTCGYGGAGPTYAYHLLCELGFAEQDAQQVFHHCYLALDKEEGVVTASARGLHSCGGGLEALDDALVHRVRSHSYIDDHYRHRRSQPAKAVRAWVEEVLDRPEAYPWAAGERVARVYLNHEAGAVLNDMASAPLSVVIEQGELQLWVEAYYPVDWADLLSKEQLEVLAAADLYPHDLPEPRGFLDRLLPRRRERPDHLHLSASGTGVLRREPNAAALPSEPPDLL